MIIFENDKYACVSCIRGHRSSTCIHTHRMLVKVRTRGRPAITDLRDVILVDCVHRTGSSETAEVFDGLDGLIVDAEQRTSGCSMSGQPILFVRAKHLRKAMFINGALQIIMDENQSLELEKLQDSRDDDLWQERLTDCVRITEDEFLRRYSHKTKCGKITKRMNVNSNLRRNSGSCCKCHANAKDDRPSVSPESTTAFDEVSKDPKIDNTVNVLTHKSVYISTECDCADDKCQCLNCLVHRTEKELKAYVDSSKVPLTQVAEGQLNYDSLEWNSLVRDTCDCTAEECLCEGCLSHPEEYLSFDQIFVHGILNLPLKRKTHINYKGKSIPSVYWWDLLKIRIPLMQEEELSSIQIVTFFDNILKVYGGELPNAGSAVSSTATIFNALL